MGEYKEERNGDRAEEAEEGRMNITVAAVEDVAAGSLGARFSALLASFGRLEARLSPPLSCFPFTRLPAAQEEAKVEP